MSIVNHFFNKRSNWLRASPLFILKGGVFLLLLCFCLSTSAQKISATISRDRIRLGETFDLKLKAEPTSNTPLLVDNWFALPDTFGSFQVVSREKIDTFTIASTKSYQQVITLTSFDSGTHALPAFLVTVASKSLQTNPLNVTVLPIDVSMRKDYSDIKDIIEPEPEQDYTLWISVGGVILLVILLFFIIRKPLSKKRIQKPLPVKVLTLETALKELDALQPLLSKQQYIPFCTALITICRNFTDTQLNLTTVSKTLAEYINLVKPVLPKKQLEQYISLLEMVELVKFAKALPTNSDCLNYLSQARVLLRDIHAHKNKSESNAV